MLKKLKIYKFSQILTHFSYRCQLRTAKSHQPKPVMAEHGLPILWNGFEYLPHQVKGVQWMLDKETHGTLNPYQEDHTIYGGIQADEMGLGKTIQMAATMRANPTERTLVVVPVALLETWIGVLVRAGFHVYHLERKAASKPLIWSTHPTCKPRTVIRGAGQVFVSNYDKLPRCPSLFAHPFGRVILDEAHKIGSPSTRINRAVCAVKANICWAMTGTPIVNSYKDLRSILMFLGTGDITPHARDFAIDPVETEKAGLFTIHRTIDDARASIKTAPPPPVIHELKLDFTTQEEADFYRGVQGALNSSFRMGIGDEIDQNGQGWKLKLFMRLRQISVHPQVYIQARRKGSGGYSRPSWTGASTKFDALADIIRRDKATGKARFIVFCQFKHEMVLLKNYLEKLEGLPLRVECFEGGMTDNVRIKTLEDAKEYADVFLIQLQAGGCGLNLQEFNRVVFMAPWWTRALMDQAIARAVRIGQRDVVHVYHLTLKEEDTTNIDVLMRDKSTAKSGMLQRFFEFACEV
jgi:SNF2 family DNA or RNA helicase